MMEPESAVAPILLALDTATSVGGVAIGAGSSLLAEVTLGEAARHSENLLPAIDFALARAGCRKEDVAGVIAGSGPGSFTGVRIAAATAKALTHAWSVPLHAWSSLAMLAAGCADAGVPVVPLFDARRGEVYGACYRFTDRDTVTMLPPVALPMDALLERVSPVGSLFVGEGATLHEDRIRARGGIVVRGPASIPRVAALLWLTARDPVGSRVEAPSSWEPDYVRASGAQRMRPRG